MSHVKRSHHPWTSISASWRRKFPGSKKLWYNQFARIIRDFIKHTIILEIIMFFLVESENVIIVWYIDEIEVSDYFNWIDYILLYIIQMDLKHTDLATLKTILSIK